MIKAPLYSSSAVETAYSFLRHFGLMLDELSNQGLVLWVDENGRRYWHWQTTDLKSTHSFWAIGEALIDAVIARYPETFAVPFPDGELDQDKTG